MKLMMRTKEKNIARVRSGPKWQEWGEWELCEGTEGLTDSELMQCIREWCLAELGDVMLQADNTGNVWQIRNWLGIEEYRIIPDNFNIESYNVALRDE